ncbi:MAG: hypothetical protein IT369_03615 [Candidatus Latescibacteria bacterium]|nr:hypothetical protein [Candidatus Latescibacterota bacterium]
MSPDSKEDLHRWHDAAPVGQPVDLAPWTYVWRADREVQETPEAYFIPRRLERLDRVYRTARNVLPEAELKSIYYEMPDLLRPLPPPPRYPLQLGLLWTGGLVDYQVELQWPAGAPVPAPEAVEVRAYPTSFGWFGWTVDQLLGPPALSADGRTWTYQSDPSQQMDSAYNVRVPAATEMVAVFGEPAGVMPDIRVTGPNLGRWQRLDVELEWGFAAGAEKQAFDGRLEPYMALVGPLRALDTGTVVSGAQWQSRVAGDQRRGITIPLLYAPQSRPGLDSRLTVWSAAGDFTLRLSDLDQGPILIPAAGVLVTRAGSGQTAAHFTRELAARQPRSVRQQTREHREAGSWEELMQEVRLWTCPEGTALSPFPEVPLPPMQVELPDPGWTAAWNAAAHQLTGEHMWGGLAFEVGRVAHQMDLIGLHAEAAKVYTHFLAAPGAKSDGDYTDGEGALEWATSMRHDMGYSHDGTHASTGRLLFAMAERYFLTGDSEWFQRHQARLQAAADWIIRQRTRYLEEAPNRGDLFVAGLMPPGMLGDYALPACDWHWYYVDNALALQGLQRFAEALAVFAPEAGRQYLDEAEAFRRDLCRAVAREAALAPVRPGRDGCYHHFIARMAYARGLTGPELGAPQFPDCDLWVGALPLAEPFAALDAGDFRMMDTLDMMEELGTSASAVQAREEARKEKGLPTADAWFWHCYSMLPKASHTANIYLLQDNVPNFLRFWMNSYASMVGADGKLWEHWHLGGYDACGAPDNGTAGWFMENFRNLLVMEEGSSLWLARATPRAWLESGRQLSVRNAPTYFGALAYRLLSEVDQGRITATLEIPTRSPIEKLRLRLRHPRTAPLRAVTVNGHPWHHFDPDQEVITLTGLQGEAVVVASY